MKIRLVESFRLRVLQLPLLLAVSACHETAPTGGDVGPLASHAPGASVYTGCTDGVVYETVFFEKNSSDLDDEDRAALDGNVTLFNECPLDRFHVEGRAANGEKKPKHLARARASAVAQYYVSTGIASDRLIEGSFTARGCRLCDRWRAVQTYASID